MGGLAIEIRRNAGRIADVAIASNQPVPAQLLVGRAPAVALGLLGTLYSVCGRAQRAAGELALAAAGGAALAPSRHGELVAAIAGEAAQEHLWRLMLDWPRRLGGDGESAAFAAWYRRCGGPVADWAVPLLDELAAWIADPARAGPSLPSLRLAGFASLRVADAWATRRATPFARLMADLRATCAAYDAPLAAVDADETGPCAMLLEQPWLAALVAAGRGLEAHVAARYVALVELVEALAAPARGIGVHDAPVELDAAAAGEGAGRAVVSTARGLLVHEVRVTDGAIAAYAIRTPTECNFAPGGPYVRRLSGVACGSTADAERLAGLWALALDPCVPFTVREIAPESADGSSRESAHA